MVEQPQSDFKITVPLNKLRNKDLQELSDRNNEGKNKKKAKEKQICPEAREFEDFISKSGGYGNGWSMDAHNYFLVARMKTLDPIKMTMLLRTFLPGIKEDVVMAHEVWYKQYLELKKKSEKGIKKWREMKVLLEKEKKLEQKQNNKKKTKKKVLGSKIRKMDTVRASSERPFQTVISALKFNLKTTNVNLGIS